MINEIVQSGNENRRERAISIINAIRNNVYNALYQMQILKEEELYKELGYNSLQECLINELNIKRTTFFNYQKVLDKFTPYLLNSKESNALDSHHIPIRKLVLLSRLPKKQTTRLFTDGKISIRGRELTISEINKIPYDKLKIMVTKKHKYINQNKDLLVVVEKINRLEKDFEKKLNSFLKAVYSCNLIHEESQKRIQILATEISDIIEKNLDIHRR